MPQVINTNVMSLNAQRNLNRSQVDLSVSLQRLSSGLRINSAKDDAAGLAIATRFTAQINGYNQAIRNANDAVSLAQTAEGALQEITNALQRMRELAVQSANGIYSTGDRQSLDGEVSALKGEISRTAEGVLFNGVSVVGASLELQFQIGANANVGVDTVILSTVDIANTASGIGSLLGTSVHIASSEEALSFINRVDSALDRISQIRAKFGTLQNRFESTIRNLQNVSENMSASRSRIQDADFAAETAAMTRAQILQQAGTAMLAQANSMPQNVLSLLGG